MSVPPFLSEEGWQMMELLCVTVGSSAILGTLASGWVEVQREQSDWVERAKAKRFQGWRQDDGKLQTNHPLLKTLLK